MSISASLSTAPAATLQVVLRGSARSDGGVDLQSSSATLGPVADPNLYHGQIVSLSGDQVQLLLQGAGGQAINLSLSLQIDQRSGAVTGSANATSSTGAG